MAYVQIFLRMLLDSGNFFEDKEVHVPDLYVVITDKRKLHFGGVCVCVAGCAVEGNIAQTARSSFLQNEDSFFRVVFASCFRCLVMH